jgi:putative thioredoxin
MMGCMQRPRYSSPVSARGVVDLSALSSSSSASTRPAGTGPSSGDAAAAGSESAFVLDVTEATFQTDVLDASSQVPVVIDFWADWCQPCKQLSPILERLADEYGGRFVLAKIDADANQMLAAQFGVQGIPAVFAVVGGQGLPLFQGALPETHVRQYLDQLLQLAEREFGMTAPAGAGASARPEPPRDPAFDAAFEALERGDIDGAAQAFRNVLATDPSNADAKGGLAQVELLRRAGELDAATVRANAAAKPDDVPAQLAAADLDMAGGHVADAVDRLVDTVARTAGADRDQARLRLLEYFDMLGPDDPRVVSGRAALTRVLF